MENQIINDLVGGEERFDYEYEDSTAAAVNDDVYNFHSDDEDFMTPRKTGRHFPPASWLLIPLLIF